MNQKNLQKREGWVNRHLNELPNKECEIINDKYVMGKSLDDKVGGFIIAEVIKRINDEKISDVIAELNSMIASAVKFYANK